MNKNDYYDHTIYLKLSWDNEKIFVQQVAPSCNDSELTLPLGLEEELNGREYNESWKGYIDGTDYGFKKFGKEIANVLLPENIRTSEDIHTLLEKVWSNQAKVRFCLLYPMEETPRDKLLEIPWEYIYLSPDDANLKEAISGLNTNISIVHWLPYRQNSDHMPVYRISNPNVKELRVRMHYSSYFTKEADAQSNILNEFVHELPALEPILNCTNIAYRKIGVEPSDDGITTPNYAAGIPAEYYQVGPEDVNIDIQNHDCIQVTSHGDHQGFELMGGRILGREDLPSEFSLKVSVLLNCISESKDSVAREFHLKGVPIVVGIAGSINFDPIKVFVSAFYSAIAAWPSHGLEKAVVCGRVGIYDDSEDKTQFGYPRLFLNGSDSTLISEELLFGTNRMIKTFDERIEAGKNNKPDDYHLKRLTSWVKQNQGAPEREWFLVTGPAGSGKSTQIAWLLDDLKDENLIYHFCDLNTPGATDPLEFIQFSLVRQLIKYYGDHYKKVVAEVARGEFPLLIGNEDVALSDFVIEPLRKLIEDKVIDKPPVFIIDGIDVRHREQTNDSSILGLLLRHRGHLSNVGRFLITADEDNVLDMEDIHRLTYHHRDGKSDLMLKKPEGTPLALFVDMKERFKKVKDLSDLLGKPLPEKIETWQELYDFFAEVVKAKRQKHGELVTDLLSVVTIAYEPLRDNQVAAILGLEPDNDELKKILRLLQPFFKDYEVNHHKLILYHDRIKKHLLQERNWWHGRNLNDAHEILVKAFRPTGNWTEITDWTTLAGTQWQVDKDETKDGSTSIPRYVRRYLVYHAYYSCYYTSWQDLITRRKRAKTFLNLICDSGFRNARLDEVGRRTALQDIWLGLRVINAEYIHDSSPGKYHTKARVAFDRLLAANLPNSYRRNELIKLEEKLRTEAEAGWKDLFAFLGFDKAYERTWWED